MMEDEFLPEENEELFEHYRYVVDKGQKPLRIDKFLANRIENASRSKIQNALEANYVLVNDKPVKSNYKVKPDDVVTIMMSEPPREIKIIPENIPLNIIYEDDDLLIVNKQAGLVVHPAYGHYSGTLVNALAFHLKDNVFFKDSDIRPGLVHRIDKNTTGLLVIAKNEFSKVFLAKQFFEHTIERKYIAIVWGRFEEKSGTITGHIGRNLKNRKIMHVFPEGDYGKHAVTHYELIEDFDYVSVIQCHLETGRTHQIRAHFKYLGHPLFNDDEYEGDKILKGTTFTKYKQFINNCFEILPRQALHAKTLGFIHPTKNKKMVFDSEIPDDMSRVIEKWRSYTINRQE
jgi:23S rRNA pseudouridine1911/1915/1917 synthase